jgi:hypothetical protein
MSKLTRDSLLSYAARFHFFPIAAFYLFLLIMLCNFVFKGLDVFWIHFETRFRISTTKKKLGSLGLQRTHKLFSV